MKAIGSMVETCEHMHFNLQGSTLTGTSNERTSTTQCCSWIVPVLTYGLINFDATQGQVNISQRLTTNSQLVSKVIE